MRGGGRFRAIEGLHEVMGMWDRGSISSRCVVPENCRDEGARTEGLLHAAVGLRAAVVGEGLWPSLVAKLPWSLACMRGMGGPLPAAGIRMKVVGI